MKEHTTTTPKHIAGTKHSTRQHFPVGFAPLDALYAESKRCSERSKSSSDGNVIRPSITYTTAAVVAAAAAADVS